MQVKILGPTKVLRSDGVAVAGDFGGVKPRQILEILALAAGAPVSKERLAELLWDGRPPRSHLGTLESYVCVLRRTLSLGGSQASGVVTVRQGYLLDPEVIEVDLSTFRSLVQAGQGEVDARSCLTRLERALDLVHGDLLADDAYAAWAEAERDSLRRELVAVETLAASCELSLGDHEATVRHAYAALDRDRLAEPAWRLLMRALSAGGRHSEALRAYFQLRQHLADELGTAPSPETTDLYLDLLHDDTAATGRDASGEVRILVRLLDEAMHAVPGTDSLLGEPVWRRLAHDVAAIASRLARDAAARSVLS